MHVGAVIAKCSHICHRSNHLNKLPQTVILWTHFILKWDTSCCDWGFCGFPQSH